jgi:hypothetical protein
MASPNHKRTYCGAFDAPLAHPSSVQIQKSKETTTSTGATPSREEHTNKENEAPSYQDRHEPHEPPKVEKPEGSYPARCNLTCILQSLQSRPLRTLAEHDDDASEETATAVGSGSGFIIFEDETATSKGPDEVGMEGLVLGDK